jgi:hypothetical protein
LFANGGNCFAVIFVRLISSFILPSSH